jgi:hypothetical protein
LIAQRPATSTQRLATGALARPFPSQIPDGTPRASRAKRCHGQPLGAINTGSAQVAATAAESKQLCVFVDIWTTTR